MLTVFLQLPDADIIFYPSFLDEQESIYLEGETASYRLLTELTQTINWRQDWITIKGRSMPQPRLTAWYSDSGKSYTLSDIRQTLQESDRALETRKSENLTTHDPSRPPKRLSPQCPLGLLTISNCPQHQGKCEETHKRGKYNRACYARGVSPKLGY